MLATARSADRGQLAALAVLAASVTVLAVGVVTPVPVARLAPILVLAAIAGLAHRILLRWDVLLAGLFAVILFIPIKRYTLPSSLPFDLEPYRVFVAVVVAAWISSLLVDPRVRLRRSGFEGPVGLIAVSILGSELVNGGRVAPLAGTVLKSVAFFASYLLVYYLVVSVVRTREQFIFLLKILVAGAAFVGATAVVENRTGLNVFNHLGAVLPGLEYHEPGAELRGGDIRAYASAQHPIALSVALTMMLPLGIYLAALTRRRRWWVASGLLVAGDLTTGSRTGFVALAAVVLVYLWLRPRPVVRLWPLLFPALLAIHFLVPGALGGIRAGFFPQGGLIAQQSAVVRGNAQVQALSNNRLADIGPSLKEFSGFNPLFGEGYGTRITGFDSPIVNAAILDDQWLKTLLETGLVGFLAWIWWIVRAVRRLAARARGDTSPEGWLYAGLAASIVSCAVCMATFDMFSFIQVTFLLFIVLALAPVALTRLGDTKGKRSRAGVY